MNDRVVAAAKQGTLTAGFATLVIGAGLVLLPGRLGRALGLETHLDKARLIGLSDVALAPALILARPRWPWMAIRAGLNLLLVGIYRSELAHRPRPQAQGGLAAMCLLTVVDGGSAIVLKAVGE
jgi:hypothetical protein